MKAHRADLTEAPFLTTLAELWCIERNISSYLKAGMHVPKTERICIVSGQGVTLMLKRVINQTMLKCVGRQLAKLQTNEWPNKSDLMEI